MGNCWSSPKQTETTASPSPAVEPKPGYPLLRASDCVNGDVVWTALVLTVISLLSYIHKTLEASHQPIRDCSTTGDRGARR